MFSGGGLDSNVRLIIVGLCGQRGGRCSAEVALTATFA